MFKVSFAQNYIPCKLPFLFPRLFVVEGGINVSGHTSNGLKMVSFPLLAPRTHIQIYNLFIINFQAAKSPRLTSITSATDLFTHLRDGSSVFSLKYWIAILSEATMPLLSLCVV